MEGNLLKQMICRDAGDKTKGFRFQKIRATIRLLKRIAERPGKNVLCAMELLGDSILIESNLRDSTISSEENKYYTKPLSFQSAAILNAVVGFIDIDQLAALGSGIEKSLFASAAIGRERIPMTICRLADVKQKKASTNILGKLVSKQPLDTKEAAIARVLVLRKYEAVYGEGSEILKRLKDWSPNRFADFLANISWEITSETNESLEAEAIDLIRKCRFFNYRHENVEVQILCAIMDVLEKRSQEKSVVDRLITAANVENAYLQAMGSRIVKKIDPAFQVWGSVELEDRRGIQEKITSVCPGYSFKAIDRLHRRIAVANAEAAQHEREYVSIRVRILDVCQQALDEALSGLAISLSPKDIDSLLENLVERSAEEIRSLSKTWRYNIKDSETIRGAVLSLFDECYLNFGCAANED